jgi:peptide methionine sulfoxide reductase MsrB
MKFSKTSIAMSLWIASSASAFAPSVVSRSIHSSRLGLGVFDKLFGSSTSSPEYPIYADESVMSQKQHGTSEKPVQQNLRWACDYETADRICNFNRHYAEFAGYWTSTEFLKYAQEHASEIQAGKPIHFYDSVTGKLLFRAPVGRSLEDFLKESRSHGWPSFRDSEVVWDDVRCLKNGECISTTGTHLGHNLPDATGNRYCINLVCVAGRPEEGEQVDG